MPNFKMVNGVRLPLTEEEEKEFAEREAAWEAAAPARKAEAIREARKAAYGDIGAQLDMLYRDILAGKPLTEGTFAANIEAVKKAHPKP